jgi:hypothetical protein
MKSVCCRRPRFSWWPGGTCRAYICQRTSGTRWPGGPGGHPA